MGKKNKKTKKRSLILGSSQTLKEHIYAEIGKMAPVIWNHFWEDLMHDTIIELSDINPGKIRIFDTMDDIGSSEKDQDVPGMVSELIEYSDDVSHSRSLLAWAEVFETQAIRLRKAADKLSKSGRPLE